MRIGLSNFNLIRYERSLKASRSGGATGIDRLYTRSVQAGMAPLLTILPLPTPFGGIHLHSHFPRIFSYLPFGLELAGVKLLTKQLALYFRAALQLDHVTPHFKKAGLISGYRRSIFETLAYRRCFPT